ncbi:hypothetical protein Tco_0396454 [Tanacetum coccineum]
MHHSMCSSTSNLVFMTSVLSLWAIPLVVPLIPTFIAISLLTCPRASLVVSSIVICRSPTVTDQMAHYVAPVAFGRTWTIMMIVAFRTQRLGPAVIFLIPVPCSVSFASILPLVRLLLVLIVDYFGSVFQLSCSQSRRSAKSADLFYPHISELHYGHSSLKCLRLPTLITGVSFVESLAAAGFLQFPGDSTFSGGGDDEGSAAANSVMHALVDDDRGKQTHQSQMLLHSQLEGTGSFSRDNRRIPPRGPLILLTIEVRNCKLWIGAACEASADKAILHWSL